jgi:hypothetical protein
VAQLRWFHRPGVPALASAAFGLLGGWASQLVTNDQAMQLVVGLLTGVAALQIGELWQMHARTPLVAKLEEALVDPLLYQHLEQIITANARLNVRLAPASRYAFTFRRRADECLGEAAHVMDELAAGRLVVSDPDQQFKFSIDLVANARRSVHAVSFRDEEFWESEAGERYLKHNEHLLKRGLYRRRGGVSRIFVFDSDEIILQLKPVIDRHIALGVAVYILPPSVQVPSDLEDFVVYDNQCVRFAEPLEFAGSRKRATLSINPPDVAKYASKFQQMMLRSLPAQAYFEAHAAAASVSGAGRGPLGIPPQPRSSGEVNRAAGPSTSQRTVEEHSRVDGS